MYFQKFPKTFYSLDDTVSVNLVTDITRRADIVEQIKSQAAFYDEYDVIDGETPEVVADKFYNDTELYWIILMANEMLDPRFDWPMSYINLLKYCEKKYTAANVYTTHHYENNDGYIVNSDASGASSVSNFDYESDLNENKRRIKIPKPELVPDIIVAFTELINK